MKQAKSKNSLFRRYYAQILLLIIAFTFFSRAINIHKPEKYMFDEVYHAVTAKLILHNDTRAYEWNNPPPEPNTAVDWLHPPLAKYTQAAAMAGFGESSFGWRFSSVIFGCLVILLTAKITLALFDSHATALLAAFLTSLDGLVFAMSRIAMNDIHVTTFILATIYFYILFFKSQYSDKKMLLFSGISGGLALGTKWSGLFVIAAVCILEALRIIKPFLNTLLKNKKITLPDLKILFKNSVLSFAILICIPACLYILSYSHMFLLGKDFSHLVELHKNIWWYQTNLSATHPAESKPIDWFLNTKPVWIAVNYVNTTTRGDIYAVGNPALFFFGGISIIFSSAWLLLHKLIEKSKKQIVDTQTRPFVVLLVFFYFMVWFPWQLSPRIMFFYHYLPAVPLMTVLLSFWLNKLYKNNKFKEIAVALVLIIVLTFVVWYPHLSLLPINTSFKEAVYFYFDSWNQTLRT